MSMWQCAKLVPGVNLPSAYERRLFLPQLACHTYSPSSSNQSQSAKKLHHRKTVAVKDSHFFAHKHTNTSGQFGVLNGF